MIRFIWTNGNPWQRNLPDCTVRNLALASGWGYRKICKALGVPCKIGYGLNKEDGGGAATVKKIISTFEKRLKLFDYVQIDTVFDKNWGSLYRGDQEYDDPFVDPDKGDTITSLVASLRARGERGRFIFIVRPPEAMRRTGIKTSWHTTCIDLSLNAIVDTFDCSRNEKVYGFMRIDPSKIMGKEDEGSLQKEIELVDRAELWGDEAPWVFTEESWKKQIQPAIKEAYASGGKIPPSLYSYMGRKLKAKLGYSKD